MPPTVLVVGGYGVFGGLLCRLLLRERGLRVLVAGRRLDSAQQFCATHGGEPLAFDRDGDPGATLAGLKAAVVIDAAGPFQAYGADPYRLARAALAAGCHYVDLADDAAFVAGIAALDAQARAAQRTAVSGASSVPAISSAAVAALRGDFADIAVIDTVILPGNRAPRGVSVVHAIVGQSGQPLRVYRGGQWCVEAGWGGLRRVAAGMPSRWASLVGVPDLALFPARYRASSVVFRAGLELPFMHLGLWLLSLLRRARLVESIAPLAPALHRIAQWLLPFGSDRGAMQVAVTGRDPQGRGWRRAWRVVAEQGEGPWIPVLPAYCLVRRLVAGGVAPGARPCLEEATLGEIEAAMAGFAMKTAREDRPATALFEQALGPRWALLPAAVREAHDLFDRRALRGEADVENGANPVARLLLWIMGMPRAGIAVPLTVEMERRGQAERWTRRFGGRSCASCARGTCTSMCGAGRFASTLYALPASGADAIVERFAVLGLPLAFLVRLGGDANGVSMPVERAWFLGVPLPRWLTPTSRTFETVDAQGRFNFDVEITLPMLGRLVRYRGWLRPLVEPP